MHNSYRECPIALHLLEPIFCVEIRTRFSPSFCTVGSSKNIICAPFSSSFYYFSNDTLSHGRGAFKVLNLTPTAPIKVWGDEIPIYVLQKVHPNNMLCQSPFGNSESFKSYDEGRGFSLGTPSSSALVHAGRDNFIICSFYCNATLFKTNNFWVNISQ